MLTTIVSSLSDFSMDAEIYQHILAAEKLLVTAEWGYHTVKNR